MNDLKCQIKQLIEIVNNMDLQGKNNLINYKLKDIVNNRVIVKKCVRCEKPFIPPYNGLSQKYCCDDCRYNSTQQSRKNRVQNETIKPIEMLSKRIHQKRYYCKRHNIELPNKDKLQQLLNELIIFRKEIKKGISQDELESRLAVYKKMYYIYTHPIK